MQPVNNHQSAADKNAIAEPAEEPTSAPATEPPPPGEMLDSMVSLLRQYLVCDDHQLTVLALWCVHGAPGPPPPDAISKPSFILSVSPAITFMSLPKKC